MPSPKSRPPSSSSPSVAKPTPLENIFEIQNQLLNRYLHLTSSRAPGALELLEECAGHLGKDDHPLLQYAAGSAAMELALRTHRSPDEISYDFKRREEMLIVGKACCLNASEGFSAMSKNHNKYGIRLEQMRLQALHAAVYTPLMGVMASRIAGQNLSPDTIAAKNDETRIGVARLGELILGISPSADHTRIRKGMNGELACGMVLQGDVLAKHLPFPASLRQDHNRAADLRADIIAIEVEEPFHKTLLQVKNSLRNAPKQHGCVGVDAGRDLVLHPDWSVARTLEGFVEMAEGTAAPDIEHRFAVAGRVLSMRVDTFWEERAR